MGNLVFRKIEDVRSYYDQEHVETSDFDIVLPRSVYQAILPDPLNKDYSLKDELEEIHGELDGKQDSITGVAGRIVTFTNVAGVLAGMEKVDNIILDLPSAADNKLPSEKAVAAYHNSVVVPLSEKVELSEEEIEGLHAKDVLIEADIVTIRGILDGTSADVSTLTNELYGVDGTHTGSYLKSRLVGGGSVTITEDTTDPELTKLVISSDGVDEEFIESLKSELEKVLTIQDAV